MFSSPQLLKQMVNLGISDINTKDLFNFRFQNTTSPGVRLVSVFHLQHADYQAS